MPATPRCERTTRLLVGVLSDTSADVRQGAVHALSRLAEVGDESATQGLARILRHCEEKKRIVELALVMWKLYNQDVPHTHGRYIDTKGQAPKTHVRFHANAMRQQVRDYYSSLITYHLSLITYHLSPITYLLSRWQLVQKRALAQPKEAHFRQKSPTNTRLILLRYRRSVNTSRPRVRQPRTRFSG